MQIKYLAIIGAAVIASTIFVIQTNIKTNPIIESTTIGNPDAPFWNPEKTRSGEPYILALEISPPHPDRIDEPKEVKYGELTWLDKAIDNAGKNTKVSSDELNMFFKYTEDGNTDFMVRLDNGTIKYYRLYYTEVP
ncbi:MAG: hypothetical protein KatS3mg003_1871 [Candidatus Nitrosocaldaceae archaeon]|nr:MAG: hypothetical protein KatS3mg003_1871 [Candidatus Nitrosocaldaceae archaeon]